MEASDVFDKDVVAITEIFKGTSGELEESWPGLSFKKVLAEVVLEAGVMDATTARGHNPLRRTAHEQKLLADYARHMVKLWLKVRATTSLAELQERTEDLRDLAHATQSAAIWSLQAVHKTDPVYVGPVGAADIMMSGFTFASERYSTALAKHVDESMGALECGPFSWGPSMAMLRKWCDGVQAVDTPAKKKVPKLLPASPQKANTLTASASPTTPSESEATSIPSTQPSQPSQSSESDASTPGPLRRKYMAVGVGRFTGVFTSKQELDRAVKGFKGARTMFTSDKAKAEEFVRRWADKNPEPNSPSESAESPSKLVAPSSPPRTLWFAAKGTDRPGVYRLKRVAESYNSKGKGRVKACASMQAAREFLGDPAPEIFRESVERQEELTPVASEGSDMSNDLLQPHRFFAVQGGSQPGIYMSLKDALEVVCDCGGTYSVFTDEQKAEAFAFPPVKQTSAKKSTQAFVVWVGRAVGIMSMEKCIEATKDVLNPKMKGPMSPAEAFDFWMRKQEEAEIVTADGRSKQTAYDLTADPPPKVSQSSEEAKVASPPQAAAPTEAAMAKANKATSASKATWEAPSMMELERALKDGKKLVFACVYDTAAKKARIALSPEEASKGAVNPVVATFSKRDKLLHNYVDAENWVKFETAPRVSKPKKSIKAQLIEARKMLGTASGKLIAEKASDGQLSGGSGKVMGFARRVRTGEAAQIERFFIEDSNPIRIVYDNREAPDNDDLDLDMPLPGSSTYQVREVSSKKVSFDELVQEKLKERRSTAWPLMRFSELMSFTKHAVRLCKRCGKAGAAANAAAFSELEQWLVREFRRMERLGTLGVDQLRFQVVGYLRLQHMTLFKVFHVGNTATTMFREAVDPFRMRLPASKRETAAQKRWTKLRSQPKPQATSYLKGKTPVSGCFLCPATDHYASDKRHHPWVDGKRPKVPAATKKKILQRISDSEILDDEQKAHEAKVVRAYWSQHDL